MASPQDTRPRYRPVARQTPDLANSTPTFPGVRAFPGMQRYPMIPFVHLNVAGPMSFPSGFKRESPGGPGLGGW